MDKSRINRLLDLTEHLEETTVSLTFNSRILLVDGLNLFMRCFCANPLANDNGMHVGGMLGFLKSLGYAINVTKPTRVIIVFDGQGGKKRRKEIFPAYKANREKPKRLTKYDYFFSIKDEYDAMNHQIKRLAQYLSCLPVLITVADDMEADDLIAFLNDYYTDSEKVIMSTDKDFLQLVNPLTSVWNSNKKICFNPTTFREVYNMNPENYLIYRCLTGDDSDGIPGVDGCGEATLRKRIPELFQEEPVIIDDIIRFAEQRKDSGIKLFQKILDAKDQLHMNWQLMQLKQPVVSDRIRMILESAANQTSQRMNKHEFIRLFLQDQISSLFKSPDNWLKEHFSKLEYFIAHA